MPPDSATLSSAVHVERAMPPTKLHIAVLPPLGPNPERNPVWYSYFRMCACRNATLLSLASIHVCVNVVIFGRVTGEGVPRLQV